MTTRYLPPHTEPTPAHPLLDGLTEIGRGSSCTVLDAGGTVFKVIRDPACYVFLTDADRPNGPHFPRVIKDHGKIGVGADNRTIWLVEMEKLYPLKVDNPAWEMLKAFCHFYRECWAASPFAQFGIYGIFFKATQEALVPDENMRKALFDLGGYLESIEAWPDLMDLSNYMQREDGTVVFADPAYLPR